MTIPLLIIIAIISFMAAVFAVAAILDRVRETTRTQEEAKHIANGDIKWVRLVADLGLAGPAMGQSGVGTMIAHEVTTVASEWFVADSPNVDEFKKRHSFEDVEGMCERSGSVYEAETKWCSAGEHPVAGLQPVTVIRPTDSDSPASPGSAPIAQLVNEANSCVPPHQSEDDRHSSETTGTSVSWEGGHASAYTGGYGDSRDWTER